MIVLVEDKAAEREYWEDREEREYQDNLKWGISGQWDSQFSFVACYIEVEIPDFDY